MLLWRYLHQELTDDDAMDYNEGVDRRVIRGTDHCIFTIILSCTKRWSTCKQPEVGVHLKKKVIASWS